MAERLFELRFREATGIAGGLRSMSVGTGDWHLGQDMDPSATRELLRRGADTGGFTASQLDRDVIAEAELILVAGSDHRDVVLRLVPQASDRLFLLRQFGRALDELGGDSLALKGLPPFAPNTGAVAARGKALVALAASRNYAYGRGDELADPWGRGGQAFAEVADQIEEVATRFVRILAGK